MFDEVHGTDPGNNLSGSRKADRLVERFGEKGFDYVGDHAVDLPGLEAGLGGVGGRSPRARPEGRSRHAGDPPAAEGQLAAQGAREGAPGAPVGEERARLPAGGHRVPVHPDRDARRRRLGVRRVQPLRVERLRAQRPARSRGGSRAPDEAEPAVRRRDALDPDRAAPAAGAARRRAGDRGVGVDLAARDPRRVLRAQPRLHLQAQAGRARRRALPRRALHRPDLRRRGRDLGADLALAARVLDVLLRQPRAGEALRRARAEEGEGREEGEGARATAPRISRSSARSGRRPATSPCSCSRSTSTAGT